MFYRPALCPRPRLDSLLLTSTISTRVSQRPQFSVWPTASHWPPGVPMAAVAPPLWLRCGSDTTRHRRARSIFIVNPSRMFAGKWTMGWNFHEMSCPSHRLVFAREFWMFDCSSLSWLAYTQQFGSNAPCKIHIWTRLHQSAEHRQCVSGHMGQLKLDEHTWMDPGENGDPNCMHSPIARQLFE